LTCHHYGVYISDLPGQAAGDKSEQKGDYGHDGNRNDN
jgi:hypothetical protein